jgi:DoxX
MHKHIPSKECPVVAKLLATDGDWVLTLARIILGMALFAHGAQKLLGWFGGHGLSATLRTFRDQLGIPTPLAYLAIAAEFFGGLGLIVGLFSRIAALGIALIIAGSYRRGEPHYASVLVWRAFRQATERIGTGAGIAASARGGFPMIVQMTDTATGTAAYINPTYVVTLRPDPADPDHVSIVRLRDGESIRVKGDHREVADKLARAH